MSQSQQYIALSVLHSKLISADDREMAVHDVTVDVYNSTLLDLHPATLVVIYKAVLIAVQSNAHEPTHGASLTTKF